MRLGLLGGSFDPIHHGHLLAARHLGEALQLDQVRLIPTGLQPLKQEGHGASPAQRVQMAELAVDREAGLVVDPVEARRTGPTYTVDTLRALAAERPNDSLVLLLGDDAAQELPRWREPDAIQALAEVVIFPRSGSLGGEGTGFRWVPVPRVEISATGIRDRVRRGRSIRYLTPDPVVAYIAAHRLYRGDDG